MFDFGVFTGFFMNMFTAVPPDLAADLTGATLDVATAPNPGAGSEEPENGRNSETRDQQWSQERASRATELEQMRTRQGNEDNERGG